MNEHIFKVVFEGDLLPGNAQTEVKGKLAGLFKTNKQSASKLFNGDARDIKSDVTITTAKKYVRALARLGALAYLMPQDKKPASSPAIDESESDKFTETGSFHASMFTENKAQPVVEIEDRTEPDYSQSKDSDATVPMDIVGAMSSDAFSSFFERKMHDQQTQEEEPSDAHTFLADIGVDEDDKEQVVTDTNNIVDMRKLASLVSGRHS